MNQAERERLRADFPLAVKLLDALDLAEKERDAARRECRAAREWIDEVADSDDNRTPDDAEHIEGVRANYHEARAANPLPEPTT